jgi:uncharacterized membrane protein
VRLRAAIAALSVVGLGIAAYLTYVHYANVAPVCTSGGCETVQRSSYAELAGVPVAVLGLVGYVLLLLTTAFGDATAAPAGAFVALAGAAFSGYLLWAQLARIHAICVWCVGNDAVIGLVALLCVARLLTEPADTIAGPNRGA